MKARAVPAASARKTTTASTNGRGPALQGPLIQHIAKTADGHFRIFSLSELADATGRAQSAVQSAMAKIVQQAKLDGLDVVDAGRTWQYDPGKARLQQSSRPEPSAFTKKDASVIATLMDPYAPGEKIEILVVGRTSDGTVILELPTGELIRTRA